MKIPLKKNKISSRTSGTLYVWQNPLTKKWYRTGVSTNGKVSLPSQAYASRQGAESLVPIANFMRNPLVVFDKPPRRKS